MKLRFVSVADPATVTPSPSSAAKLATGDRSVTVMRAFSVAAATVTVSATGAVAAALPAPGLAVSTAGSDNAGSATGC